MGKHNIEVCLSPALFEYHFDSDSIAVIVDTLRATSAICSAFANGAEKLIPVATVEQAREMKSQGFVVAAERDGYVLDFADFGNSPFNFTEERVKGKTIVYSTTNGTRTIEMASSCHEVVIGSFLNISILSEWLITQNRDIVILCAGWKNKVNIEDSFYAGALCSRLLDNSSFISNCDSARICMDMWSIGKDNPVAYIDKAAQRTRLKEKGLDDCIPFCHKPDSTDVIPAYKNGEIIKLEK
mgnify:CR=1 FL=1